MNKPYSIKIFLPGGDPEGIQTIEKSNWSGAGIVFPRVLISNAKDRKDLARTGVYVLVGPPEESGLIRCYIGEGDPIKPRLEDHASKKEFWTRCIAFTSKDENLNKAHVQWIESRLISLATRAKRCVLENGNAPSLPSLSEADAADAEPVKKNANLLFIKAKGINAQGMERPDGFVVQAGSGAVTSEVTSCHGYIKELRAALISNGVLKPACESLVFTQDYLFSSPSTAAGVVQGRSSNGRVDWKTAEGKPLKELQG